MPLRTVPPLPPTSLPLEKVTLYLEDVQTIFDILERFGQPSIRADNQAADGVGDLADFGKQGHIDSLHMEASKGDFPNNGTIRVDLSTGFPAERRTGFYGNGSPSSEMGQAIYQIRDFVRSLARPGASRIRRRLGYLQFLLLGIGFGSAFIWLFDRSAWLFVSGCAFLALYPVYLVRYGLLRHAGSLRILPIWRRDHQPFWKRKKDDLILVGITAMLTAVLTIPATVAATGLISRHP